MKALLFFVSKIVGPGSWHSEKPYAVSWEWALADVPVKGWPGGGMESGARWCVGMPENRMPWPVAGFVRVVGYVGIPQRVETILLVVLSSFYNQLHQYLPCVCIAIYFNILQ